MRVNIVRNPVLSVSIKTDTTRRVTTIRGVQVPSKFRDLGDFDATNLRGNNLVIYDSTTQKFKTLPVDDVLAISVEDGELPEAFSEQISDDINLDGGSF